MPRGKARLAWSQTTSAGAVPCSCRTTKGGGSSRPISGTAAGEVGVRGRACGGASLHVALARPAGPRHTRPAAYILARQREWRAEGAEGDVGHNK